MSGQAHEKMELNAFKKEDCLVRPRYLWFLNVALTVSLEWRSMLRGGRGAPDERCDFCFVYGCVFCPGYFVPERLRTSEVKVATMLGNILLILISIVLCGYLFYALLKPEKF